ncbi:hypothetical protein F5B20DRAFT_577727 [Whalleya microplaca]|nr:hypothetical protein F5B20DRAFT_577727 [Whalleya microplaca]
MSKADLKSDDLTLSSDEFDSLVKGVKRSGELDLVTWEGYYESTATPDSDPLALLIMSKPLKAYLGSRGKLLDNHGSYAIDYTLTTDGKIEFTTVDDGKVSLMMARRYDDDTGTATVGFTGTRKGATISGSWAKLPLYLPDDGINSATLRRRLGTLTLSAQAVGDDNGSDDLALFKTSGSEILNEATVEYNTLASENCNPAPVSFHNAATRMTNDVLSRVNQDLKEKARDYDVESANSATPSLRDIAKSEFERSLEKYVKSRIAPAVEEAPDKLPYLPYYDALEERIEDKEVSLQANPKIAEMGPSTSYDPVARSAVVADRGRYCQDNYTDKEKTYGGAEQEYEDAKKERVSIQSKLDEVDAQIEKDKAESNDAMVQREQARKEQLEKDLKQAESDERDKEGKKDEAESKREDAMEKKDRAGEDAKNDKSREKWDGKVADVFGK